MYLGFNKLKIDKFSKSDMTHWMALAWLGVALHCLPAWGQTGSPTRDSQPFTIEALYAAANQTHPLLLAARLEAQAGTIDITAVQRQRWPTLSAAVESNTGNTTSLPSHSLRVQQIVWDGGLVSSRVTEAQMSPFLVVRRTIWVTMPTTVYWPS